MPKEDYRVSNLYKKSVADSPPAEKKERFSNTPSWLSAEEKARLKLRLVKAKRFEQRTGLKEDVNLLKSSGKSSTESGVSKTESENRGSAGSTASKGKKSKKDDDAVSTTSKESKISKGNEDKSKEGVGVSASKESSAIMKKEKSSKEKEGKKLKGASSKESTKSKISAKGGKTPKSEKGETKKDGKSGEATTLPKEEDRLPKPPIDPSGHTMKPQPEREIEASNLDKHLWASEFERFDPQLYRFKSPEKLSTKMPVIAECPPFWVLLDHTIAVVWKLFCPSADRKDLGIIPLQWCMEFVRAMRDERGEHLPAIARILSAVEDALIDRYAKVADKAIADGNQQKDEGRAKSPEPGEAGEMYYASSDSFFKYRAEVSYTLKDIMARNLPGRRAVGCGEDGATSKDTVVGKVDVPPPEDPKMSTADLLAYLRQMKKEQEARICKEKEHSDKIDALMDLIAKGKIDGNMWLAGHDAQQERVSFEDHDDVYGGDSRELPQAGRMEGDDARKSVDSFRSADSGASTDEPSGKKKKKKALKETVKEVPEKVRQTASRASKGSISSASSVKSQLSKASRGSKGKKTDEAGEPEPEEPKESQPEE